MNQSIIHYDSHNDSNKKRGRERWRKIDTGNLRNKYKRVVSLDVTVGLWRSHFDMQIMFFFVLFVYFFYFLAHF